MSSRHSAVRLWSWRSLAIKKGPGAQSSQSFISRQNDVYLMTLRGASALNCHHPDCKHLVLGDRSVEFQVIQQNPPGLAQVGVVFWLGLVWLGRDGIFVFFLQLFERLFTLGLATDVFHGQLLGFDIGVLCTTVGFIEADGFFGHQLLGQGQFVADEHELRVFGRAHVMLGLELRDVRFERVDRRLDGRTDGVPRHGFRQGAFADFLGVDDRRVIDVRQYALMLGALTGNPVELGQGQFQFAMVQRLNGLHGAFAEGLAADDQCTVVVLHRTGEDLRRRGGQTVDQQRHRAFVERARVFIFQYIDPAVGVTHQHGRTFVDEQAGQFGGFLQGTAAVVAQVDDHAVDLVFLQFGQQLLDVAGGALVVRIAGTEGLEVQVEGRDLDDAELVVLAILLEAEDRLLHRLIFKLHRFAGDRHDLAGLVIRRIAGRNHFQAHHGAFRTTNQFDHFVQAPADHVDHLFVALGHADDLVGRSDLLGLVGRAGRHQAHDFDLIVIALQHGANALQGQAHVDVEVLRVIRRQIVGMWVVRHGEGVDVRLEDIFRAGLVQTHQLILVTLGQGFLNLLWLFAGDLHPQHFVLDAFAPQVVELGGGLEPRGILAVDQQGFLGGEVDLVDALVQLGKGKVQTRLDAIQIALVDGEPGVQVAALEEVVELGFPFVEFGNVTGHEVAARWIQQLEVAVVDDHRARIVERRLAVMVTLEQFDDVQTGDDFVAIGLKLVPAVGCERIARHRQETETNDKSEGGAGEKMLHADSTRGQLITHIRPSLKSPVPTRAGRIMQESPAL
ncbi:hypothetical protein EMIT0180MI3_360022 [Priestia megaterium]